MKVKEIAVTLLFVMLTFSACSKNSPDSETHGKMSVPAYSSDESPPKTYETDLSTYTKKVVDYQDEGTQFVYIVEHSGVDIVDPERSVQLTEIYKNDCPKDVCENDDVHDAESLGIGTNALVTTSLDPNTVRDQSERGTCVAFALSAAVEVLENRESGSDANISEQDIYFVAKLLTNTWDDAGLVPEDTVNRMTSYAIPFVDEGSWPYNPYQDDCSYYNEVYPTFYCSETEAQGGGYNDRQQDPHAASADGAKIEEAHQLYASVDRVREALYRGYPVLLSVNVNSDFRVAPLKDGVVSWVFKVQGCESGLCGHAVLAIGFQDDEDVQGGGYVIVKNSWGEGWGDGGYAYVTYEWLKNSILDAQAIVSLL
jgi:C1A family cysteine protease